MSVHVSAPPPRLLRDCITPPMLAGSVALTAVATAFTLWLPGLLGRLVDDLVAGPPTPGPLLRRAGGYLAAALIAACFSKWMRQLPMRWGPRVCHRLRSRLYSHLLNLDEHRIREWRVGELMSRLQSDVNAVGEMLSLGSHSLIRAAFTLGMAFTLMFRRSPALAWGLSLLLPLVIGVGFLLLHAVRSRHLRVQEQLGRLTGYCQESFGGLRVIRGLGLEAGRLANFQELNTEYIRLHLLLNRIDIISWPLIQTAFVAGNVLVIWMGGLRVIEGQLPLGTLVEFQQYLMILQWPTLSIAWTLSLILRGRASAGRLREVLAESPRVLKSPAADLPPLRGDIRFEQVSLSIEGQPLLHAIDFHAAAGEILGITGPTGSGKTLLLHLLLRRRDPDGGHILVDGMDLRARPLEALYRDCRIAPQEPVLFSMSLEENLRLARPEATEAELQQALSVAGLEDVLKELPRGLQTPVGERGVTLSGGQRQRAAIARALLGDPPLLLLDDSLSAVDTATETRILGRLLRERRGRGLWMVSHRYAALRHCDRVLVLREGAVAEFGTPEELLRAGGYFAELEARQRLQAQLEEAEA